MAASREKIQIKSVSTKEDCLKGRTRAECISIYMIDSMSVPFVDFRRKMQNRVKLLCVSPNHITDSRT